MAFMVFQAGGTPIFFGSYLTFGKFLLLSESLDQEIRQKIGGTNFPKVKKLSERPTTKAVSKDKNQNQEVKYYSDIRTLKPGP
ncbi:MAG: hypothetical protein LH618_11005, partial [Saprospiraceae bacterium]|nr:hypothetical protein [Saprospiraceae bacterium]